MEGQHLLLVRYKPDHNRHIEWVYNGADIDGSKVVWARDMGAAQNAELIDYFRGRHIWLLEADESPRIISPYPRPDLSAALPGPSVGTAPANSTPP
jgi:hypothetical protein